MNVNLETWLIVGLTAVVIPSVSWLVIKVLAIELSMTEFHARIEQRMSSKDQDCGEHRAWTQSISQDIKRIDRNVTRLCTTMKVPED